LAYPASQYGAFSTLRAANIGAASGTPPATCSGGAPGRFWRFCASTSRSSRFGNPCHGQWFSAHPCDIDEKAIGTSSRCDPIGACRVSPILRPKLRRAARAAGFAISVAGVIYVGYRVSGQVAEVRGLVTGPTLAAIAGGAIVYALNGLTLALAWRRI